jgi:signal transduction histidine kinase
MVPGPRFARQQQHQAASLADVSAVRAVLYRAAEYVEHAASELLPGISADELSRELAVLCELIENDSTLIPAESHVLTGQIRRRLLRLLRAEVVHLWSQEPCVNAVPMIGMMVGFERLAVALELPMMGDETTELQGDALGFPLVVELAHDLRSPLTSILFLSETLMRGASGSVNEIQQRQLGIIYSAALSLIGTASDVIELAQRGDPLAAGEPTPFSLTELVEAVRDMVLPIAEEKGLELRVDVQTPDRRVGHPILLSRIVLNLTTNALKFTDQGQVEVCVRTTQNSRVEFSVRDTGRGIDESALATLYQPIRRRSGHRRGYQIAGTGLGLSICKKLVAAMDAELKLDTRPGLGTRFFFEIELPPAP